MAKKKTNTKQASTEARLNSLIEERGKVYGDAGLCHANIGLTWTGLLQQHYGITLPHPVPDFLVAQMMSGLKGVRSARVFHQDNYDDARNYLGFAEEFQKPSALKAPGQFQ